MASGGAGWLLRPAAGCMQVARQADTLYLATSMHAAQRQAWGLVYLISLKCSWSSKYASAAERYHSSLALLLACTGRPITALEVAPRGSME